MRALLFSCLLLGACASSTQTFAPDGSLAYNLNCSGTARNWGMCYTEAGNLCGTKGYKIVQVNGETGEMVNAHSKAAISGNPYIIAPPSIHPNGGRYEFITK